MEDAMPRPRPVNPETPARIDRPRSASPRIAGLLALAALVLATTATAATITVNTAVD